MIGWYVHHHGSGHLHRAMTVAPHLPEPVTGLSSLPRPAGWQGPWVQLPRDDAAPHRYSSTADVDAHGRLHWVPVDDPGLRARTHAVSAWIESAAPSAFVVDQSVEITLLARLHGVPVVGLTAPGRRVDAPHRLGFDVCSALVGAWPRGLSRALLPGVAPEVADRFEAVGACSRLPVAGGARRRRPGPPRVVLMAGDGGDGFTAEAVRAAQQQTPEWEWTVLSRRLGAWHADPGAVLADADVAVIHPGQNSLAEVAALRVPAVVVPAHRPFDEQHVTASVLADGWPAVVLEGVPERGWGNVLETAADLEGQAWEAWCDGQAPRRIAGVVMDAASRGERAA